MNTPTLAQIVGSLRTLPSLPTVVIELLQTMSDEDVDIDRMAHGIGNDQALAARTLRVANSPFYGMQGRIDTIAEAITVLGFVNVRALVTTAGLATAWPVAAAFDASMFWRHSLAVASCAQALAVHAGMRTETLFLAGLLHDIGRLVLVATHPEIVDEIARRRAADDCLPIEAELSVLGFDHAGIGSELCRHWRIPESIADAVERHHRTNPAATGIAADMADVLHLADIIAHALDLTDVSEAVVPTPQAAAWQRLGLDRKTLGEVLEETERQFESMANILGGT